MRRNYISLDLDNRFYNKLNALYPNKIHSQYLDEVDPKAQVFPYITLKTQAFFDSTGIKRINIDSGRARIVIHSKVMQDTFDIEANIRSELEKYDAQIEINSIRADGDKIILDNKAIYYRSLDIEFDLFCNEIEE